MAESDSDPRRRSQLRIKIRAKPSGTTTSGREDKDERLTWTVSIAVNNKTVSDDLALQDPLTREEKKICSWYLQQYAQQSPFSVARARAAEGLLQTYPQSILRQLSLISAIEPFIDVSANQLVWIEVSEDGVPPDSTVHQLYWELLEESAHWMFRSIDVLVRRSQVLDALTAGPLPLGPIRVNSWPLTKNARAINILLVVARDLTENSNAYEDISPFISSTIMIKVRDRLKESGSPLQIGLEIVRPGTFAAFEDHLEQTRARWGLGYYTMVHFDLHGAVKTRKGAKSKASFLYFNHPQLDCKKPVEAEKVGKLLQKHQIPVAVLNACESARANAGDDANIAKVFAQHGVENVLAMSFKVSSHAAEIFLRSFYQGLLLQGRGFSEAVSEARSVLRGTPIRYARFRLEVPVMDWFVPVTYFRGAGLEIIGPFTQSRAGDASNPRLSEVQLDANIERSTSLFGREFDLLRLEKALAKHRQIYLYGPAGIGKTSLLQHGCSLWRVTSFFDAVILLDFADGHISVSALQKSILRQLLGFSHSHWTSRFWTIESLSLTSYDDESVLSAIRAILPGLRVLVILDNLHSACGILPEPILPTRLEQDAVRDVNELFQELFSSDTQSSVDLHVVLVGRRENSSFLGKYFNKWTNLQPFRLPSLGLADGMEFAQTLLEENGEDVKAWTHDDFDALELIVSLLDGVPAAIRELLFFARILKLKWQNLYDTLHRGEIHQHENNLIALHSTRQDLPTLHAEIFKMLTFLPDDFSAVLIILSAFWLKGPLQSSFWRKDMSNLIHVDETLVRHALIVADDRGLVRLSQYFTVSWIHPLLTIYARNFASVHMIVPGDVLLPGEEDLELQDEHKLLNYFNLRRKSSHASLFATCFVRLSSADLSDVNGPTPVMLLDWFSESLYDSLFLDEMVAFAQGFDTEELRPRYAPLLPNILTATSFCLASNDFGRWPWEVLQRFADHLAVMGTTAESKLCVDRYERIIKWFTELNGGLAISPEYQAPVLHIVQFLIRMHRSLALARKKAHSEFIKLAEDMLAASESRYGSFKGHNNLYEKGYVLRQQIFSLLEIGQRKECLDKIQEFLEVDDATYKANEAFVEDNCDRRAEDDLAALFIKLLASSENEAQDIARRMSPFPGYHMTKIYHETRRQIAADFVEMIRSADEEDDTETSRLEAALNGLSGSFLTIKKAGDSFGVTGVDKDPSSMPPGGDMLSHYRRYDNPLNRLQELEIATESGAWMNAIEQHEALLLQALQDIDYDGMMLHVSQLINICEKDPIFDYKVADLRAQRDYFVLLKASGLLMNTYSSENHSQAATQAKDLTDKMLKTVEAASGDREDLQQAMEMLKLSSEFWEMESAHGEGCEYFARVMRGQKASMKGLLKKLLRRAGNKDYLQEFTNTQVRVMQLHLEIQRCELSNQLDRALVLHSEMEKLAKTEFAPYLIDLEELPKDRERLEWKRDWNASVLAWRDAISDDDYVKSREQLNVSDRLRILPIAKEMNNSKEENFVSRCQSTERFHWSSLFSKARNAFESNNYAKVVEQLDSMLSLYDQGQFSRLPSAEIMEMIHNAKVTRARASWNDRYETCSKALLAENDSTAAKGFEKLLNDHAAGEFSEIESDVSAVKSAKTGRLMALARLAFREQRCQECMQYCDEYQELHSIEIKADPCKYDWLVVLREDAEVAYHNNEYLKADYAFEYPKALQQIGKLLEIMEYRERTPKVDRSGSAVSISKDLVNAMRMQVLQKKQVMDSLGPVAGRQFIQAARTAMGFQPQFKS